MTVLSMSDGELRRLTPAAAGKAVGLRTEAANANPASDYLRGKSCVIVDAGGAMLAWPSHSWTLAMSA